MASPNFQPSSPDDLPSLQEDTSPTRRFECRLPDPAEVLRWGGVPGCLYAFVSSGKLSSYRRAGWSIARGTDSTLLSVVGPKGECDIFVLVRGKPIPGADPANGVREWFLDPTIFSETGLETAYPVVPQRGAGALRAPLRTVADAPLRTAPPKPALKSSEI